VRMSSLPGTPGTWTENALSRARIARVFVLWLHFFILNKLNFNGSKNIIIPTSNIAFFEKPKVWMHYTKNEQRSLVVIMTAEDSSTLLNFQLKNWGIPHFEIEEWGIPHFEIEEWGIPQFSRENWGIPHRIFPPSASLKVKFGEYIRYI
jgi:hypothetical protein